MKLNSFIVIYSMITSMKMVLYASSEFKKLALSSLVKD